MPIFLAVIIALVLGFVIGLVVQRIVSAGSVSDNKTAKELSTLRKEYHDYQEQVSQHMQQTSSLISTIQGHYDEVQEHIFSGGKELNRASTKQNVLQPNSHFVSYGADEVPKEDSEEPKTENQPPKDYA